MKVNKFNQFLLFHEEAEEEAEEAAEEASFDVCGAAAEGGAAWLGEEQQPKEAAEEPSASAASFQC